MGGATFFVEAEDVMNPESWSPEDFVTLLMCCPESLLVPFAGVGAAQLISRPPRLLLCSWNSLSVKTDQSCAGWPGSFSTFLMSEYTCSGQQGAEPTVVHVTGFVHALLVTSGLPVTWRCREEGLLLFRILCGLSTLKGYPGNLVYCLKFLLFPHLT